MNTAQGSLKRIIDILASALILLFSLPFLCFFALIIRATSKGPALFLQKRVGKDGQLFTMLKLRTMCLDAPDLRNPDSTTFNSAVDPRVTPFGQFLRTTSCDELPQFLNVLLGTMSLVGPRPELPAPQHRRSRDEIVRLGVRPGITGLAVIHGRNEVPFDRRRALDAQYVDSWSLQLDFRILMKTILITLQAKGVNRSKVNQPAHLHLETNGLTRH
jgi:lipopolysaccharide/colanic/teichoic acid biosynthesis glycosyltransferase